MFEKGRNTFGWKSEHRYTPGMTVQTNSAQMVSTAPWPGGKRWVYSITFDEALREMHQFVIPILESVGIPGHAEVVVGHIGTVREIGESSYNGFHHMNADELRDLLDRGWGVGNHSWSHFSVTADNADRELREAKEVLEEAVGEPITVYCSPGCNDNMNDGALAACREYGYLGAMSLTDALNRPDDDDLLWINRTFLHHQGYAPFFSEFDPFRNIQHARRDRGWLIDYLHCPFEEPVHPNKDCSQAQMRERVETICEEGGSDVWLARVEDVIDYRYTRRATVIVPTDDGVAVSAPDIHPAVRRREVTLQLPAGTWRVDIDGKRAPMDRVGGELLVNVDVSRPRRLLLYGHNGS